MKEKLKDILDKDYHFWKDENGESRLMINPLGMLELFKFLLEWTIPFAIIFLAVFFLS
jgi:hypothetical protein